jgi:hypothetical protein
VDAAADATMGGGGSVRGARCTILDRDGRILAESGQFLANLSGSSFSSILDFPDQLLAIANLAGLITRAAAKSGLSLSILREAILQSVDIGVMECYRDFAREEIRSTEKATEKGV